jgi:hypothetical protein
MPFSALALKMCQLQKLLTSRSLSRRMLGGHREYLGFHLQSHLIMSLAILHMLVVSNGSRRLRSMLGLLRTGGQRGMLRLLNIMSKPRLTVLDSETGNHQRCPSSETTSDHP